MMIRNLNIVHDFRIPLNGSHSRVPGGTCRISHYGESMNGQHVNEIFAVFISAAASP